MKASILADARHNGPVRLANGHQVFRFVRWTGGKRKEGQDPSDAVAPRMVRLSRADGVIADCRVTHRYISPDTEIEPVAQIVSLSEYQTAICGAALITAAPNLGLPAIRMCIAAGALAALISRTPPQLIQSKKTRHQLAMGLGEMCACLAILTASIGLSLDQLPPAAPIPDRRLIQKRRGETGVLLLCGTAGEVARIAVEDATNSRSPKELPAHLSVMLVIVRDLADSYGSDLFSIMSANVASQSPSRGPLSANDSRRERAPNEIENRPQ